jgi:hypothetical protein
VAAWLLRKSRFRQSIAEETCEEHPSCADGLVPGIGIYLC